ncbi:MAG TPA: TonB-dependent receptor [Xanthobacteraceae bacterium]|jgi:vitamin B12 transporter|nr:TonB-dependent receptor [Xanthobacteraceae bacterium]
MCGPALAQTPVELPRIVITATTLATPADQIPNSVTVITAEDIQREQRRTVPDALSAVPGLNVVQTGGPGGQTSVFMRGTNSNHVKVLVDGIDVSDPSNPNQSFDFGQMLTGDIERIEVLRGPQSGLYGSDAIGGVISITTKRGEGPPKISTTVEGGSFGTFNQTAALSGSTANFNYAFNVLHYRATDVPVTPTELLPPGQHRNNNLYDNWTYSTKLGAELSDVFGVSFVGRYTDSKLRFTGDDFSVFPSVPAALQSTQVDHQFFSRTEAAWSLLDGRFKNYFGVAYSDSWSWNQSPSFDPSTNNGQRTKFDWRGVAAVAPGQNLVFGLEDELFSLQTIGTNASNANRGAYAEWQSDIANRFFLVSNIRHDDNDAFGGHDTWRVAPAVLVPGADLKLKASYGTGFKAPTLSQLFVSFPEFHFFANPNLKPEESKGYDFGFEKWFLGDRFRFGATYFHNNITNLITTNDTFTSYTNVGQATTYGVEAFARYMVMPGLVLQADYTHTIAKNDITGQELLRRPINKASLTTTWQATSQLALSSTVLYVDSWKDVNRSGTITGLTAPSYTVVNVAANYVATDHVTVFGRIDNLFNRHYENPIGFDALGLGVFGGVRVTN